ncbi:hypothetical protein QQ045_021782 [Rhodiola kirilowii]
MASKKVIAICQFGGEFFADEDGSMVYNGGDAYAIDLDEQTNLNDFRREVAETFDLDVSAYSIKYFLPGNKKTLITVSKDKDLSRMISFVSDSGTVDVFVSKDESPAQFISNMPAFSSKTTISDSIVHVDSSLEADAGIDMNCNNEMVELDCVFDTPLTCVPVSTSELGECRPRKAVSQWENTITGVDQRFNSFKDFREALHKYSIAHGFAYKYKKNDSHRVSVKCKQPNCPWRIYASKLSTTQLVCIKKMIPEHTCDGSPAKAGYRATRGWIGNIIKEKLKENPNYKPKDIVEDIKREYGIQLNYSQAWRAKEIAREQLQGSYKEAYSQLPFFCEKIIETNPGSIATFTTKEDSSFHRLFVSFGVSIVGFQLGCRPLIFLDNYPLNSKYQGVLLTATAADANDGIFPVAFAVVDIENEDNWHWFLEELKSALSPSQPITFVADFQNGLKEAISNVFGNNCHHAYCLRYLAMKLNKDLKGQFSHEARRFMNTDFEAAAYASKPNIFEQYVHNIKAISPIAYDWVIESEPKQWANVFFQGARYNLMTSNFGQAFYSWVSEANEFPITQLVEVLRSKIMEGIYARRIESAHWMTVLTPAIEERLKKEMSLIETFTVLQSHENTYEVQGETVEHVNVDVWDCTCRMWQLTGLPCCHALAVLQCTVRNISEYCSRYFTVESYRLTYAEPVHPVPNVGRPSGALSNQIPVVVTPPPTKRLPGRPKMNQVESLQINKRQLQCSRCKGLGHNKKTCKDSEMPLMDDQLVLENGQVINDYKIEAVELTHQ